MIRVMLFSFVLVFVLSGCALETQSALRCAAYSKSPEGNTFGCKIVVAEPATGWNNLP